MELREAIQRSIKSIGVQEIARRSGVAASTISRIGTGKIDPGLEVVEKIAQAVGIKIGFTIESNERPESKRLRDLKSTLGRLNIALKDLGVREITVFGSVARGDDRPDSDIDLYVDYGPKGPETGNMLRAEGMILEAFPGTKVDFVTNLTTPRGQRLKVQIEKDGRRVL